MASRVLGVVQKSLNRNHLIGLHYAQYSPWDQSGRYFQLLRKSQMHFRVSRPLYGSRFLPFAQASRRFVDSILFLTKKLSYYFIFLLKKTFSFVKTTGTMMRAFYLNPRVLGLWLKDIRDSITHMVIWVKTGFKLFAKNVKYSRVLIGKLVLGRHLSLREHKLLLRTVTDTCKLVPFSFFIIIPFAELALPIVLYLFPNMLPSTFIGKSQEHANMQRRLRAKKEMVTFFDEIIAEKNKQFIDEECHKHRDPAIELSAFQDRLKDMQKNMNSDLMGDTDFPFPTEIELRRFSLLFKEVFKLDKMDIRLLNSIIRLLGLQPYPTRALCTLQLRHHLNRLKADDRHIMWEGVDRIPQSELASLNRQRGMPCSGVSEKRLRDQLSHWILLSSDPNIPTSLLLWSRTFFVDQGAFSSPLNPDIVEVTNGHYNHVDVNGQENVIEGNNRIQSNSTKMESNGIDPLIDNTNTNTNEDDNTTKLDLSNLFRDTTIRRKMSAESVQKRLDDLEAEAQATLIATLNPESVDSEEKIVDPNLNENTCNSSIIKNKIIKKSVIIDKEKDKENNRNPVKIDSVNHLAVNNQEDIISNVNCLIKTDDEDLDRDELHVKIDRLEEELLLSQRIVGKQNNIIQNQISRLSSLHKLLCERDTNTNINTNTKDVHSKTKTYSVELTDGLQSMNSKTKTKTKRDKEKKKNLKESTLHYGDVVNELEKSFNDFQSEMEEVQKLIDTVDPIDMTDKKFYDTDDE